MDAWRRLARGADLLTNLRMGKDDLRQRGIARGNDNHPNGSGQNHIKGEDFIRALGGEGGERGKKRNLPLLRNFQHRRPEF